MGVGVELVRHQVEVEPAQTDFRVRAQPREAVRQLVALDAERRGLAAHHQRGRWQAFDREIDSQQHRCDDAARSREPCQPLQLMPAFHMQCLDAEVECAGQLDVSLARPAEDQRHVREVLAYPCQFTAGRDFEAVHERRQRLQDRQIRIRLDRVEQLEPGRQAADGRMGVAPQGFEIVDVGGQRRACMAKLSIEIGGDLGPAQFGRVQGHAASRPASGIGLVTGT